MGTLRWLALAVVGLAACAALVVAERRPIAEHLLLAQLREAGLPEASLSVGEIDLTQLVVRELRIGPGDVEIAEVAARYSIPGLLARRLEALHVQGLRARGTLRDGELRLAVLCSDERDGTEDRERPAEIPLLPVDRLEVEDAILELDSESGPLRASLDIDLDSEGMGRVRLHTDALAALLPSLGLEDGNLVLAGTVSARPDRLELDIATGDRVFELAALGLEARDLSLELALDPATRRPRGSFRAGQLRDLRPERRFNPLALEIAFRPGEGEGSDTARDSLDFDATLRELQGSLRAQARGSQDLAAGGGRAELHLDPVHFAEDGLAPADVLPGLAALIPSASGSIEAHGEMSWNAEGLAGFVDFGLRDLALDTGAVRLERINTVVRVDGPWPARIPGGQLLSIARVDFGLELTGGIVSYGLRQDGILELATATWSFAGGTIRTSGSIDLFAREKQLLLSVEDVDLAQLLALVNLAGLSGEGRLEGRLPLTLGDGRILIRDALLESTKEGGWLRYTPEGGAAALGAVGEMALDDLLGALKDFHFERLALSIDGDAAQALVVKVSLLGANPAHRDGQPYDLNLSVDGRLADLVRQATAAYHIPDHIEQRLEQIAAERR